MFAPDMEDTMSALPLSKHVDPNLRAGHLGRLESPARIQRGTIAPRRLVHLSEDGRPHELQTAKRILDEALALKANDLWGQLGYFFKNFRIPAARGRARAASNKTQEKYYDSVSAFFDVLHQENIRPRCINDATVKHLKLVIQHWEARGLSASTLTNRFTCIRRFMHWMGKGGSIPAIKSILVNPKSAVRSYSATQPHDWESNTLDPSMIFAAVKEDCPTTAMHLRLQHEFGLRTTEALSLKPVESDNGHSLLVHRGTKGGRARNVPILRESQREALEAAKAMVNARTGLLSRHGHNLDKARAHYYYVLQKHGITRKDAGVTSHGLRHGYVGRRYEEISGELPPVRGGGKVDPKLDLATRAALSLETGHVRPEITTAYTGSVVHVRAASRARIEALVTRLDSDCFRKPFLEMRTRLAEEGLGLEAFILGTDAEGQAAGANSVLLIGVRISSTDLSHPFRAGEYEEQVGRAIEVLTPAARQATLRMAIVANLDHVSADMPRCEVLF